MPYKNVAIAVGVGLLAIIGLWWLIGSGSSAERISTGRVFIDATTGKSFNHTIERGETIPVEAPSGGKTGYEAELCFWTKDGQAKDDPTYVLLNEYTGEDGPTFCPDCGRRVVGRNPPPDARSEPPPTREEYESR